MKKLRTLAKIVAPLAASAMIVASCTSSDDDGTLVLGTGSVGGTYYPLGGAIAQMWSENLEDVEVSTVATGASVENLVKMSNDEIQLGMAVNGVATQAINGGTEQFPDALDFRMIGNIYPEVMQIVARADSGITTVADLDGKRVAIGPDGSGTQLLTQAILDAAGVTPSDTFADGFGDAADKIRDGQVDAAFGILAAPDATLTEVAQNADVVLVSVPEDMLDDLQSFDATLSAMTIAGGTYPGIDADATTVTNWATLYAPTDLDDDMVYDLTKAMYEGEINHAVAEAIQIETALDGRIDVEVHPGAEKYFEEVGALE